MIVGALGYFFVTRELITPTTQPPPPTTTLNVPPVYKIVYKPLSQSGGWSKITVYRSNENSREDIIQPEINFDRRTLGIGNQSYDCYGYRTSASQLNWQCRGPYPVDPEFQTFRTTAERSAEAYFGGIPTTITPIASKRILGFDTRCFYLDAGETATGGSITRITGTLCLHPNFDLILEDHRRIVESLNFDPISNEIFELPAPLAD